MAPRAISSLSSPTLRPVRSLICARGLNPALIICMRSCPMSRPEAEAWLKASASAWNLALSPMLMSPIASSRGATSRLATPKPSIVWAALARSPSAMGVRAAKPRRRPKSASASCWLPSSTRNEVSRPSISRRTPTISRAKPRAAPAVNRDPAAPRARANAASSRAPSSSAAAPMPPIRRRASSAPRASAAVSSPTLNCKRPSSTCTFRPPNFFFFHPRPGRGHDGPRARN